MMLALALRFQIFEVPLLVTWLACRQQNFLILLDNVEVFPDNDSLLCALLDDLLAGVPKLKILVTCNRQFYDGPLTCKWQMVDVMSDADICTLIQQSLATQSVSQNCRDKDITELSLTPAVILSETTVSDIVHLCQGNPFLCKLIINSLHLSDVQYRLLLKLSDKVLGNASVRENSNKSRASSTDKQSANGVNSQENVLRTLQLTMASLPPLHQRLLDTTSKFAASFSASEIQFMLTSSEADEISAVEAALTELHEAQYLTASHTRQGVRYRLPALVRLALSSGRSAHLSLKFVTLFVGKLTYLKDSFFSRDSLNAFIDFNEDVDSINDFLLDVAFRDSNVVYDALRHVASLVYVVLFTTLLPEDTFVHLYTRLASVAERCSDITVQAAALSCLAWHQLVNQQYSDARQNLQIALDAQLRALRLSIPVSSSSTSAFCQLCQARLLWIEQQEKAIELAREAVDALRTFLGHGDLTTLIASEICDMMLIDRSSFVNQSVTGEMAEYPLEAALGVHPLLLRSYGSRRLLWDKFGLFLRARDMAAKAVDIARHFYADHPLTADALVLLASSDVKLGAVSQALDSAVAALAIRRRTLGAHEKTACAYVMVARILRRACRYDDAVVSAERALDMYEMLSDSASADRETIKTDVKTLISQCVAKQRYVPPSTTPVSHEGVPLITSEVTLASLQFQQTAVPTKSGAVKPVPKPKPKLVSARRGLTSSGRNVQ
jgi:tetratricopeptide (TPR) repeat protein